MAFTRSVLVRAAPRLTSPAEDAELTILLAAWGIPISLALETCVVDPKPRDARGAVRQRARWFRGQAEILRRQPAPIAALLRRGPPGWALLASIFLQPKSVFIPLKAFLALASAASWSAGLGYGWLALAGILAGTLAIDFAGLAAGLWLSPHRRQVARALLAWPVFLAVWLASLGLSLVSRRGWQRVRPEPAAKPRRHEA
jgi:cellulose synthase/poly-beta-1,6-N-acetylglucosamine synthase-like glycosyltransferase